jgi:hypothetical protein
MVHLGEMTVTRPAPENLDPSDALLFAHDSVCSGTARTVDTHRRHRR